MLPVWLSLPLAEMILRLERKHDGSRCPPIRRGKRFPDADRQAAFDALLNETLRQGPNIQIEYSLPYPRVEFLHYLCDHRGYVAHGTPVNDLEVLKPIRYSTDVTEFGNRQLIFATPDAAWAMWFAILDKNRYHKTHNMCLRVGHRNSNWFKFYYFDLPAEQEKDPPFSPGIIYLARAEKFPLRHRMPMVEFLGGEFEEWGSDTAVQPEARLQVTPQDFPYLAQVEFLL